MRPDEGAMRVDTIEDRGIRILSCTGKMMRDGSDERLIGACDAALENGDKLVIDLLNAAWMDSSGVGALVACAKHAAERGAAIKVALPDDGPVRKVFALCHLERVFDTFRDVAAAVASYRK
jgi:anti-sigma B factor antagonist